MSVGSIRGLLILSFLILLSCATPPPPPTPGCGTLWGFLTLVPRTGVWPDSSPDATYGPRHLQDAEPVDYRRPGFAVVWVDGRPAGPSRAGLLISSRLEPAFAALSEGGILAVTNRDAASHTISCPALGILRSVKPAETVELKAPRSMDLTLFVLDLPGSEARVFVAPGPLAVASPEGRWELRDLPPGPATLQVWHPRFPPLRRSVTVAAGSLQRLDLELGVERTGSER